MVVTFVGRDFRADTARRKVVRAKVAVSSATTIATNARPNVIKVFLGQLNAPEACNVISIANESAHGKIDCKLSGTLVVLGPTSSWIYTNELPILLQVGR